MALYGIHCWPRTFRLLRDRAKSLLNVLGQLQEPFRAKSLQPTLEPAGNTIRYCQSGNRAGFGQNDRQMWKPGEGRIARYRQR